MDGGRRAGRPGGDYGSEGWGFESLRARHIIPARESQDHRPRRRQNRRAGQGHQGPPPRRAGHESQGRQRPRRGRGQRADEGTREAGGEAPRGETHRADQGPRARAREGEARRGAEPARQGRGADYGKDRGAAYQGERERGTGGRQEPDKEGPDATTQPREPRACAGGGAAPLRGRQRTSGDGIAKQATGEGGKRHEDTSYPQACQGIIPNIPTCASSGARASRRDLRVPLGASTPNPSVVLLGNRQRRRAQKATGYFEDVGWTGCVVHPLPGGEAAHCDSAG